jgi:pantoate--beta-alanine ligase
MLICTSIKQLQDALASFRLAHQSVALVPTMGNLHEGHLQLVRTAKKHADAVLVTIFVNPTQFGANEDLDNYPRTLAEDTDKLDEINADILFTPSVQGIYPQGGTHSTTVHVPQLTNLLCGAARPGHFDGVTTIVNKLFNMTKADVAIFGEKDFQQLAVIRRMVSDLNISITIIGEPIVREQDGLAMSSRNGYLTTTQRDKAPLLNKILISAKKQILEGNDDYIAIEMAAKKQLIDNGFKPDYFSIVNQETLAPPADNASKLVVLVAAHLGTTRLIDNLVINDA